MSVGRTQATWPIVSQDDEALGVDRVNQRDELLGALGHGAHAIAVLEVRDKAQAAALACGRAMMSAKSSSSMCAL